MMRTFLRYLCVAAGIAASGPLAAQSATSMSGEPVPANSLIAIGQPHSLVLTWTVTVVYFGAGPSIPFTLTSTSGQFMVGATVLGTVNTMLTVSSTALDGVPKTVRLPESVMVPPDVTVRANRLGAQTVNYVRVFSDGVTTVAAREVIVIGGSGAGLFGITREALAFDDGAAVRVVQKGDKLSARAEIDFTGAGSMSAVWEIAGPSSTAGQPQFRELQQVTRGLIGREPEIVKTPDLPTDTPGYYLLRLRITQPPPGFDTPVLAYYVGDAAAGGRGGFTEMVVTAPGDGALFDPETRFAWQPVAGTKVYKIELFGSPDSDKFGLPDIAAQAAALDPARVRAALAAPPAAGMIVAGAQTQIALSSAVRARLLPRHSYFWRVQAIGADGGVIGAAQVRQLRVP